NEFQPNLINGITGVLVGVRGGYALDDPQSLTPARIDALLVDTTLCRCLTGDDVLSKLYFDAADRTVVSSSIILDSDYQQFWQGIEHQPFARLSGRWSGTWFLVSDGDEASVFSV